MPGRKRGLAVDALGLIIAVVVMAASATDNQIGVRLIDRVARPGLPMPPSRNDIRNDNGARTATCPTCRQPFTPIRRQTYCTPACRQAAWRSRHPQPRPVPATVTPGTGRRASTVYRCPHCDTRYLAQQWCHDCHTPCTRLDVGGPCPHCDEPVAISDIIEQSR